MIKTSSLFGLFEQFSDYLVTLLEWKDESILVDVYITGQIILELVQVVKVIISIRNEWRRPAIDIMEHVMEYTQISNFENHSMNTTGKTIYHNCRVHIK